MITISQLQHLSIQDISDWGHNGYVSDSEYRIIQKADDTSISFTLELAALPARFEKTWTTSEEDITSYRELLQEGHSFGAFDDGRLTGWVICSEQQWNNTLHIENILVDSSYRRKGVGGMLLKAVTGHARNRRFRQVTLETQSTNVPAIRFYQKQGFAVSGVRLGLYDDCPGEEALFMAYLV